MSKTRHNFLPIREAMADFHPVPRVEPNERVSPDRVFTPDGHRSVLDLSRQLVVGNRGMGKSLWTHALTEAAVRKQVAEAYDQPALTSTDVVIGFNGSDKLSGIAPTREAISRALKDGFSADEVWRAAVYRALISISAKDKSAKFSTTLSLLRSDAELWEETLSSVDDQLLRQRRHVLILFDALDRLADDWQTIRLLTKGLLKSALALTSFRSIRLKIFIRPDQYSDDEVFKFPDGSKLKNNHVDLDWQPNELFGLLFFETMKAPSANAALSAVASDVGAMAALRFFGKRNRPATDEQKTLVDTIAGPYMGADARRGRVYTWVPLHLSDAANSCSPRTFLTAWQKAAEHNPAPSGRAVDHLGLIEGVRKASSARLEELREDYRWIDDALGSLRGQHVPIERKDLLGIWNSSGVAEAIMERAQDGNWLAPVELIAGLNNGAEALLNAMKNISVMEERGNGKINVPDIFRVEAGIKRRGGVAVPRKG